MSTTPSVGVVLPPSAPPESLRVLVELAADQLDEVWFSEDCFHAGALPLASSALAWTTGSGLAVGVGLLPVPLHPVTALAMDLSGLCRLHPGRLRITLGNGVQPWMAQAGVRSPRPLTLLRESLRALRRLLAGEEVHVDGTAVHLDRVRLAHPPVHPPPLLVGGALPRTLALARDEADGTVLSLGTTTSAMADTARRLARDAPGHAVVAPLLVATGPGARRRLVDGLATFGIPAVDDLGVAGDRADVVEAARRLGAAGVSTVLLHPTSSEPDLPGVLSTAADVRTALRG